MYGLLGILLSCSPKLSDTDCRASVDIRETTSIRKETIFDPHPAPETNIYQSKWNADLNVSAKTVILLEEKRREEFLRLD